MIKRILLLLIIISTQSFVFGQQRPPGKNNKLDRADEYYENFDFLKAISMYEKVIKKDSSNTYAMHKIAKAYQWIGKDEEANSWLELVLDKDPTNLEARLQYGMTLLSKGNYSKAMDQFVIYHSQDASNAQVEEYINMPDFHEVLTKDSARYKVTSLSINSSKSDYGPAIFNENLLFTSSRDREVGIKRKNTWTNEPFLDIYYCEIFSDGTLGDPQLIGSPITSKFHEGSSSYDYMTNTLYFTRTAFYDNELEADSSGVTNIEIFSSVYNEVEDEWGELQRFPHNNGQYSVAQPSVSADGKSLYFVSDMPGGVGGTDIWVCFWDGAGWTEPRNVGRPINTPANEKNPFIDKDGTLYFASKGHVGLGGLDIYSATPNDKGFDEPVNLGYPVNTRWDDFSFAFVDKKKKTFYYASNREGGMGEDDIYFAEIQEEEPLLLAGNVIIKESLKDTPIKMLITDQSGNLLASDTLTKSRPFELPIAQREENWNMVFYPLFEMEALESRQDLDPSTAEDGVLNVGDIVLGEDPEPAVEGGLVMGDDGQDPSKGGGEDDTFIPLPNPEDNIKVSFDAINFGFDKSNLTDKAKAELDELVKLMKADPESTVELAGHTDSRGSKTYNLRLSERRTTSTLNYLVANGIDASRITTNNYGELQLINHCEDGVSCSKAEHAANRRVEIKVSKSNNP